MYANKRLCFDSYGSSSEPQVCRANLETKPPCIQRMQALQRQAAGQGGVGIWRNAIAH